MKYENVNMDFNKANLGEIHGQNDIKMNSIVIDQNK